MTRGWNSTIFVSYQKYLKTPNVRGKKMFHNCCGDFSSNADNALSSVLTNLKLKIVNRKCTILFHFYETTKWYVTQTKKVYFIFIIYDSHVRIEILRKHNPSSRCLFYEESNLGKFIQFQTVYVCIAFVFHRWIRNQQSTTKG